VTHSARLVGIEGEENPSDVLELKRFDRVSSIASDGIGEPTIARFIASRPFACGTTRVGSWSVWVTWMFS
jgi:hypothetical protein